MSRRFALTKVLTYTHTHTHAHTHTHTHTLHTRVRLGRAHTRPKRMMHQGSTR
jgi:hypothetical protein